jgi:transposase
MAIKTHENVDCVKEDVLESGIMQASEVSNLAAGISRMYVSPLNPELNPICYLLALLRAYHFLHVSRIRVKSLTFRRLMSYIYGAPILDVSRSHTTTQHSR